MAALIPRPEYPPYSADEGDAGRQDVDIILSEMERKVYDEYRKAAIEMREKADEYLQQFIAEDTRRANLVAKGEMSAEDYMQWRISHIATGRRWYEMAAVLASDMTNANQIAASIINGYLPEVFAVGFNYGLYQGEIAGGFETSFTLYDRDTVMRLMKEEPDLLPIEAKINVAEDMRWNVQQLSSAMTQAIVQGESIEDIAERLVSSVAGMNERSAIRNARTATTSAENGGRYNGYRRLRDAGADLVVEWCATLDGRTRHTHRLLDGQRRDVDKPFEVDGQKILYAGDPYAPQGLVWNCRCTMLCWVKGFEESLFLKAQTNPDNMTYAEWKFAKQEEYERSKAEPKKPRVNPDNPSYGFAPSRSESGYSMIIPNMDFTSDKKSGIINIDEWFAKYKPLDTSKAVPVLRKESETWIAALSAEEKRAIVKYSNNPGDTGTGKFYHKLNSMLRGDLPADPTLTYYADIISGALKKFNLQSGIICYRAVKENPLKGLSVGDLYIPKQYLSTSVTPKGTLDKEFKMMILAAPGSDGAYIEKLSQYPKQREFLFNDDCKYVIVKQDDGFAILEVIV